VASRMKLRSAPGPLSGEYPCSRLANGKCKEVTGPTAKVIPLVTNVPDLGKAASRFDRLARLPVQMRLSPGWTTCESPIGPLTVVAGAAGIAKIHFDGHAPRLPAGERQPLRDAVEQLESYFGGERRGFELELDLRGSEFQRAVWRQLLEIPYGATTTYGQIARAVEEPLYEPGLEPYRRPRAVGAAIGANPVPVLVACHRVVGADGSLTGYFGGLERKRTLLRLEGLRVAGDALAPARPDDAQMALL
jgi:methylated-DNA-[protein]-cysteine S-methyltransferase